MRIKDREKRAKAAFKKALTTHLPYLQVDGRKSDCSLQGNITWCEMWGNKQQDTESLEQ